MAKVSKLKKRVPGQVAAKAKARKTAAKPVAAPKEPDFFMLGFKASRDEKQKLQRNADRFSKGNLSAWIRRAGTYYVPPMKKTREVA